MGYFSSCAAGLITRWQWSKICNKDDKLDGSVCTLHTWKNLGSWKSSILTLPWQKLQIRRATLTRIHTLGIVRIHTIWASHVVRSSCTVTKWSPWEKNGFLPAWRDWNERLLSNPWASTMILPLILFTMLRCLRVFSSIYVTTSSYRQIVMYTVASAGLRRDGFSQLLWLLSGIAPVIMCYYIIFFLFASCNFSIDVLIVAMENTPLFDVFPCRLLLEATNPRSSDLSVLPTTSQLALMSGVFGCRLVAVEYAG